MPVPRPRMSRYCASACNRPARPSPSTCSRTPATRSSPTTGRATARRRPSSCGPRWRRSSTRISRARSEAGRDPLKSTGRARRRAEARWREEAMPQPYALTLTEAAGLIRERKLSSVELVDASLARIDRLDGPIKAWAAIDRIRARGAAAELDREAREGRFRGPLHGVPVGIKDIFYSAGLATEGGSKSLAGFVPADE